MNDIKQKMNKISDQHNYLDYNFSNIKNAIYIKTEQNPLKPKIFLFLIILLAMIIYIIEYKYEKNKNENNQKINNVSTSYNSNSFNNQNSTKLYLSL